MPSTTNTSGADALSALKQELPGLLSRCSADDKDFLEYYICQPGLEDLLTTHDLLLTHKKNARKAPTPEDQKEQGEAVTFVQESMDQLDTIADRNDSASELYLILASPHFRALMESYDDIVQKNFIHIPPPIEGQQPSYISAADGGEIAVDDEPDNQTVLDHEQNGFKALDGALKMVGIRKEPGEELGVTVSRQDYYSEEYGPGCEIIVERIMSGSQIEQQGLLHVGDVIREVNGVSVDTPETLQKLMRQAEGTITLKVIPAPRDKTLTAQLFVRAHFSYNPDYDALIPCKEAGLPFHSGDILQVMNQDDAHWWQARHWLDEGRAGLIPSVTLQERRKAFTQSAPDPHDIEYKVMGCGLGRKKKKVKMTFNSQVAEKYENTDLVVYEEVARIPGFQRKVVVLLGAQGVGRRTIRTRLVQTFPDRYEGAVPTTSRPMKRGERSGDFYHFAGRDEMEIDIQQGHYLEHGLLGGNIYGTKMDTVREICGRGRTVVLDCGAQALKLLRTSEFMPYVIFLAAPSTECMKAMYEYGRSMGLTDKWKRDEDFRKTMNESCNIERNYRHLFDWIVINDNMDAAFEQIAEHLDNLLEEPQWVPVTWLY